MGEQHWQWVATCPRQASEHALISTTLTPILTIHNRRRAMPHIKSYMRVAKDGCQLAWFILTSANMSGAAWGKLQKGDSQLHCCHWEMGVLFTPRSLARAVHGELFSCAPSTPAAVPRPLPAPSACGSAEEAPSGSRSSSDRPGSPRSPKSPRHSDMLDVNPPGSPSYTAHTSSSVLKAEPRELPWPELVTTHAGLTL